MSILEIFALFGIMVALAALPSASVALVVVRSATLSVANGIAVAIGIVLGDVVFILLAIFGLSFVAEAMGGLFIFARCLGAVYLLWLGFALLRSSQATASAPARSAAKGNLVASFLAGFMLTLSDIKAIAFYVSLLPVFIDLAELHVVDVLTVIAVMILGVGGVKVIYAFSARKVALLAGTHKLENAARKAAGSFMIGAGSYLIVKA